MKKKKKEGYTCKKSSAQWSSTNSSQSIMFTVAISNPSTIIHHEQTQTETSEKLQLPQPLQWTCNLQ